MSAVKMSLLALSIGALAGCGQQLVEFADGTTTGNGSGPSVTSTDPLNASTGVVTNKQVTATFNKAMDAATINASTFTLKQGSTAIAGAVSYAGTTALFIPNSVLGNNLTYDATVTIGAKDTTGLAITADYKWSFTTAATVVTPPPPLAINLGLASTFGLASQAGLTSTGVTVVKGDVALYPLATCSDATGNAGASQTCLSKTYSSPTGMTVNGSIYWAADPFDNGQTAHQVTNDLNTAWVQGKNKIDNAGVIAGDEMNLKTFNAGVYHNANLGLAAGGTATLDAQNDANAVFIFKVDSTFVDSGTLLLPSKIVLVNGAQARNIWFVIGLDATIGSGTTFNGNILAGRTVTVKDGSKVLGRVLAGASGAGALTLTGAASPSVTSVTVPQ
jgi:hypothetical protein